MRDGRLPELFPSRDWIALAKHYGLTKRQRQIARLICLGLTNDEVAIELGIAPHTVRMHKQALYKRLQIRDRIGVPVHLVLVQRRLESRNESAGSVET